MLINTYTMLYYIGESLQNVRRLFIGIAESQSLNILYTSLTDFKNVGYDIKKTKGGLNQSAALFKLPSPSLPLLFLPLPFLPFPLSPFRREMPP